MADRRQFLGLGVAAAGCWAVGAAFAPRTQAATSLSLMPLAGRLSLVQGGAASIVVASANRELLLVDGGAEADAKALRSLLQHHYPGQKLKAVFNTHWHRAQTGFNALARAEGADVIAHENTRLWLTTDVNSRWENRIYKALPVAARPNRSFIYDPQSLEFGGGTVQYVRVDPAHTDGDIYVRFAEENLIVTGDLLSPGRYPVVDTATNGYVGGINTALRTIAGLSDAQTKLVPGAGAVSDLAVLQKQLDMGNFVLTRMSEMVRKGGTFREFVATSPTRDFDAQFGDPTLFLKQAWDSAWYQVNTAGGLATGLPPTPPAGKAR